MKEVFLLGVGHSTPFFAELAEDCGFQIKGLFHYNHERTGEIDHGYEILGSFDDLLRKDIKGLNFILTMGDMDIKESVSQKILAKGGLTPTLIHPNASISKFAKISDCGALITSHCEIHSDAIINEGCVLWPQVIIEHNTMLANYVFCGPKAYVGAYINVGRKAFIGQCSVCISGKVGNIGEKAIIGAGAVVTKEIFPNTVVCGNPSRIMKG